MTEPPLEKSIISISETGNPRLRDISYRDETLGGCRIVMLTQRVHLYVCYATCKLFTVNTGSEYDGFLFSRSIGLHDGNIGILYRRK